MRLTERRLRRIIRDVIAESMRRHPDTAEEVHQFHQDLRDRIAQDEEDEMYRLEQEELDREEMFIKNETEMYRTLSSVHDAVTITQKRNRALTISFELPLQDWLTEDRQMHSVKIVETLSRLLLQWFMHAQSH